MSDTAVLERSPSATDTSGRDQRGRFVRGNAGGTGNPFARQVAALRAALIASVTAQDIQRVMAALLLEAGNGNVAAARLVLAYTIGKPADAVDPDRVDVDEWQVIRQAVAPPDQVLQTFQSLPVQVASHIAQATLPVMGAEWADQLAERLEKPVGRAKASDKARGDRPFGAGAAARAPVADPPVADASGSPGPSINGNPRSTASAPPAAVAAEIARLQALAQALAPGAAPSSDGANGPHAPSSDGANGPAAPSPAAGAPQPAPAAIGTQSLATIRRLSRLGARTGG
jgi:hypothetical protein